MGGRRARQPWQQGRAAGQAVRGGGWVGGWERGVEGPGQPQPEAAACL